MATETIRYGIRPLIATVAGLIVLEFAGARLIPAESLAVTGILRCADIVLIIGISIWFADFAKIPGILPPALKKGVQRGAVWSAAFAFSAGIGAIGCYLSGIDPLDLVRVRLPDQVHQVILLFLVGGVIGPIAEELFFRGVIFGFLRRWGFAAALLISTVCFGFAHGPAGFGWPQLIGGIVFAAAYEYEKNLIVPILVHISGNLALFSLGFF